MLAMIKRALCPSSTPGCVAENGVGPAQKPVPLQQLSLKQSPHFRSLHHRPHRQRSRKSQKLLSPFRRRLTRPLPQGQPRNLSQPSSAVPVPASCRPSPKQPLNQPSPRRKQRSHRLRRLAAEMRVCNRCRMMERTMKRCRNPNPEAPRDSRARSKGRRSSGA